MDNPKKSHFCQFLASGNIVCDLAGKDCREMVSELAEVLCRNTAGLDKEKVVAAVMERETIVPTVVAPGLAVPHARLEEVDKLLVALGTSANGVDFHAGDPVHVAIMILTPKNEPGLHLQVLAALGRDFSDPHSVEEVTKLKSPDEVMQYFNCANVELVDYLRAKDIMDPIPKTLQESDSLSKVIAFFAHNRAMTVPVLDPDGDLRGVVTRMDVLKHSLPDHILWMDDLTPIYHFQPFAEMLRDDKETKVADFMSEKITSVDENIPAIQVAKMFLVDHLSEILVTRNSKLAGIVKLDSFITKLFWE